MCENVNLQTERNMLWGKWLIICDVMMFYEHTLCQSENCIYLRSNWRDNEVSIDIDNTPLWGKAHTYFWKCLFCKITFLVHHWILGIKPRLIMNNMPCLTGASPKCKLFSTAIVLSKLRNKSSEFIQLSFTLKSGYL